MLLLVITLRLAIVAGFVIVLGGNPTMTPKTEAERRFDRFIATMRERYPTYGELDMRYERVLFSAIFDPLPPEPESKSPGRLVYDALGFDGWSDLGPQRRAHYEQAGEAAIAAHEARRPKPTVEAVIDAFARANGLMRGELIPVTVALYTRLARAVFPLFGVTP